VCLTDFATMSKRLGELWATVPTNEKYVSTYTQTHTRIYFYSETSPKITSSVVFCFIQLLHCIVHKLYNLEKVVFPVIVFRYLDFCTFWEFSFCTVYFSSRILKSRIPVTVQMFLNFIIIIFSLFNGLPKLLLLLGLYAIIFSILYTKKLKLKLFAELEKTCQTSGSKRPPRQ
jgi:hypothetical protein